MMPATTGKTPPLLLQAVLLCACLCPCASVAADDGAPIDFAALESPILFRGDAETAYRDPAAIYHDGLFHLYFTVARMEREGAFWYLGHSRSTDLRDWTEPELLTPRDRNLNFASPGNVVRFGGEWVLCLQTYPTPNNETFGTRDSRIWIMRSPDLRHWGPAELLGVKGPDVARADMGRMIDPYLFEDKDVPGRWWCFYKQNGVSMSWSRDLKTWTYVGHTPAGENACVLVDGDEYVLIHSPRNGVGIKRSPDLRRWRDEGPPLALGQAHWPWAQGRLTAAVVLDLCDEPRVGRYLMFFHGSSRAGLAMHRAHGHASLAVAWSDDLKSWSWPGKR